MDSHLVRTILSVLAGYLVILLFLFAYEWITEEYPSPPSGPGETEKIPHPFYYNKAMKVVDDFHGLSRNDRDRIKNALASDLISMEEWLAELDRSDLQVICMGEFHEESTRRFLAREFFEKFRVDLLMLEATPEELKGLLRRRNSGRTYFPLLGADIVEILNAAMKTNPNIKICGIEQTRRQEKRDDGSDCARDESITRNFWQYFETGRRHVILFGGLHCTNEPNWLFGNIDTRAPSSLKHRLLNVRVMGEHQSGPVEGFVYFLDEIGLEKTHFVIPETAALHPFVYENFQSLARQLLRKFSTLIVFRT